MTPEEAKQIPAIVPLEFWTEYEEKRDEKGNVIPGEYVPFDKVRWVKKGTTNGAETSDKVARVRKHDPAVWSVIERYYEAWKKNEDTPVDGTPVDALPFVSKQLAKVLKAFHIYSAEDFAEAPDSSLQKMNVPGVAMTRQKCRTFLEAKKNEAIIAEKMAAKDAQIEAMQAQIAELTAAVQQLSANLPKRARPKDVAEKEAA